MAEYLFAYGKTNINKTNAECSGTTVALILIKIYTTLPKIFFFLHTIIDHTRYMYIGKSSTRHDM